ncbi:MAG TPA: hypothetical protein VKI17_11110, partial [Gemmataceae bacterium]|nr:hypothetical protein [Gemmataceae bacterium]
MRWALIVFLLPYSLTLVFAPSTVRSQDAHGAKTSAVAISAETPEQAKERHAKVAERRRGNG